MIKQMDIEHTFMTVLADHIPKHEHLGFSHSTKQTNSNNNLNEKQKSFTSDTTKYYIIFIRFEIYQNAPSKNVP